jgi:hypothetical protein
MYQVQEKRSNGDLLWYDESSDFERAKADCHKLAAVLSEGPRVGSEAVVTDASSTVVFTATN